MLIGVPSVRPSNVPERIWTVSGSLRGDTMRDWPGRRRSRSGWMSASVSLSRGGQPSTTTPTPPPWLSPQVVMRNRCPNVFATRAAYGQGPREVKRAAGTVQRRSRASSPLTPAPLRGEGVSAGALGGSTGRTAFGNHSDMYSSNAGKRARYWRIARRAPSPLKGERAGVRGEAVRLARPTREDEFPVGDPLRLPQRRCDGQSCCANRRKKSADQPDHRRQEDRDDQEKRCDLEGKRNLAEGLPIHRRGLETVEGQVSRGGSD